jgi:predicted alpha/beta-hydrolase family hydrolase
MTSEPSDPAVPLKFVATPEKGEVSALLRRPEAARALLVLGHGASTNMRHAFLTGLSDALAQAGVATFRYQFPYMERGGGGLDSRSVLLATVRSAVAAAHSAAPDLPLFAGGHSMSGRMTSMAAAEAALPHLRGILFVAFPLHPAGKPATERAEHLAQVTVPMLFLSGTRDDLADMTLLRPVVEKLGDRATLHVVETADHGFKVLKRSRGTDEPVLDELARTGAEWMARVQRVLGGS